MGAPEGMDRKEGIVGAGGGAGDWVGSSLAAMMLEMRAPILTLASEVAIGLMLLFVLPG